MIFDVNTWRSWAHLKNSEVEKSLQAELQILQQAQQRLRDEIDLRWNQGKMQQLEAILETINTARSKVEELEAADRRKLTPRTNAF